MMNLNIFKIIVLCLFISCKTLHVENKYEDNHDGINYITKDFQYLKIGKKSGTYIYPKINFKYTIKKGKLDGEMSLIKQKDTLYFCYYIVNKPVGRYINELYLQKYTRYRFIMTMSPAVIIDGEGVFNSNHNKEGYWREFNGNCSKKGNYVNGLKNGIWEVDCFSDAGAYENKKAIIYKNDTIVSSIEK